MRLRITPFAALLFVAALVAAGTSVTEASELEPGTVCRSFPAPVGGPPSTMVTGRDGSVWVTAIGANRLIRIGRDHVSAGVVPIDGATGRVSSVTVAADGSIWYSKDVTHRIGRFPAGDGAGNEYELPAPNRFTRALAAAPDGRVWYVDPVANLVGFIDASGRNVSYPAPNLSGSPLSPTDIAIGPDGSPWVTSASQNAVDRVDAATGAYTRFDIPAPNAQPAAISRGSDGNMWFVLSGTQKIARITPDGRITEYSQPLVGIESIATGPDGAVWFGSHQGIGRLDPATGRVARLACAGYGGMTVGPDRHLWVMGDNEMSIVSDAVRKLEPRAVASPSEIKTQTVAMKSAIKTVAPQDIAAAIAAHPGKVVVQFSSSDSGCGPCLVANSQFDRLHEIGDASATYLRVNFQPWTAAGQNDEVTRLRLGAVPAVVVFENRKEVSRYLGVKDPAELKASLGL